MVKYPWPCPLYPFSGSVCLPMERSRRRRLSYLSIMFGSQSMKPCLGFLLLHFSPFSLLSSRIYILCVLCRIMFFFFFFFPSVSVCRHCCCRWDSSRKRSSSDSDQQPFYEFLSFSPRAFNIVTFDWIHSFDTFSFLHLKFIVNGFLPFLPTFSAGNR